MQHSANNPRETVGGANMLTRDGYDRTDIKDLTTADVESATVYGHNDETIGSINSLKVGTDGKITDAVIDVGGFLGIGAHSVMMPFSELTVLRATSGTGMTGPDIRVHLDTTKEKLKAMPHHAG
jgi:hypothetical protein